jgi:hypothetical protein
MYELLVFVTESRSLRHCPVQTTTLIFPRGPCHPHRSHLIAYVGRRTSVECILLSQHLDKLNIIVSLLIISENSERKMIN